MPEITFEKGLETQSLGLTEISAQTQIRSDDLLLGPIEKTMRSAINKLVGTSYVDTFDWSIYDRLSAKLQHDPPRGGVVFKTTFKLVNHHSSCGQCHYALEIDSYGRGCVHDCAFCYARDLLNSHGYWNRPMPFPVDLSEVRKIMYTVFETDRPHKWREILEKRIPVRIGSMSDSFMSMDRRLGVTKELLRILNFYKYPYVIFTRSDLVAADEYLKLIDKTLGAVQISMSGNNERLTKLLEPGAPSPQKRIEALRKLSSEGVWNTVRINPLFPSHPDGYFTDERTIENRFGSKAACPVLPLIQEGFIESIAEAGTKSVLAGFVRLSSVAIQEMSRRIDLDLKNFFRPEILKTSGDKKFSDREIGHYYRELKKQCDSSGVRFSTCYIGNGEKDYFQYQALWTNKKDCCDVVGNVAQFKSTSQDIPFETRLKFAGSKIGPNRSPAEVFQPIDSQQLVGPSL